MTSPTDRVRPVPAGYATLTPWIITKDTAGLLDFLAEAFGAQETARVANDDGSIGHAEARIGDSVVMAFDGKEEWPDTPAFVRLYVEDGDATYQRAIAAGATSVTEMTELFFGDRVGRVRDPFGNLWWIQQRIEDLDEAAMYQRAGEPEYVEAMRYVQGAQIVLPA